MPNTSSDEPKRRPDESFAADAPNQTTRMTNSTPPPKKLDILSLVFPDALKVTTSKLTTAIWLIVFGFSYESVISCFSDKSYVLPWEVRMVVGIIGMYAAMNVLINQLRKHLTNLRV